ncbi:hypothetical protein LCGC14_2270170 [marine sediment metagenome]|uniref:Uncharacterized protein n=1 Tax=marine sediment metagenome TaxID=412755 RepID=A0A0F9FS97_9ZZZZ
MLTLNVELRRNEVVLVKFTVPITQGECGFHWQPNFDDRIAGEDSLGEIELREIVVKSKAIERRSI